MRLRLLLTAAFLATAVAAQPIDRRGDDFDLIGQCEGDVCDGELPS